MTTTININNIDSSSSHSGNGGNGGGAGGNSKLSYGCIMVYWHQRLTTGFTTLSLSLISLSLSPF